MKKTHTDKIWNIRALSNDVRASNATKCRCPGTDNFLQNRELIIRLLSRSMTQLHNPLAQQTRACIYGLCWNKRNAYKYNRKFAISSVFLPRRRNIENCLVLFLIFSFFQNFHVSLFINSSSYTSHISLYINISALINAFDHSFIRVIWNCLIHFIGNFMLVKIL